MEEKNCPFSWEELLFILMFNWVWALHFECSLVFKWNSPFRTGKLEDCIYLELQSVDCGSLEWVLWLVFYSIFFSPCCLHHVQLSHLLEIQGSFICSHLCLICMIYFHPCWLCVKCQHVCKSENSGKPHLSFFAILILFFPIYVISSYHVSFVPPPPFFLQIYMYFLFEQMLVYLLLTQSGILWIVFCTLFLCILFKLNTILNCFLLVLRGFPHFSLPLHKIPLC